MPTNQGEYQIRITSVADLAAVEQARAEYQRLKATLAASGGDTSGIDAQLAKLDAAATSGQAAAVRALAGWQAVRAQTQQFKGDTRGIDAEIAKLQATLGGGGAGKGVLAAGVQALGNAVHSLPGGSVFATMFSGGGAAVAGLGAVAAAIGAVKHGLDEYAQRQEAVSKLDQQLANASRLTAEYREQIHGLADAFSAVSGIDDTTWLQALGKIQSKDATANLAQNAELLKNMAARTGDVDQAATLLSRALAGSFDRLRMYGYQIDEGGTKTEKLKQLMEQAAKGGAGVFEARLETLTGQKQRLSTATNQLLEGVGRLAFQMGLGGGTARRLGDAVEWLTSKLPQADPVLNATTNKTDGFAKALAQATGKSIELGEHSGDGAEGMNTTGEAADKLAEKLAKATAAIDANVAAALRMQDAELADQIAQIDAREAAVAQRQGGKLTPQQKQGFAQEKIDARGVATKRKLDLREGAAEQEVDEITRAQQQPTQQLAGAQAKQDKSDAAILAAFADAGVAEDATMKPAEQAATLADQLKSGQETIRALKKDLVELELDRKAATSAAADGDLGAGADLVQIAEGKRAITEALVAMEAATAPLATLQLKLGDLAQESKDAGKEVEKLKEVVEKLYGTEQEARGKLAVIRIEKGTAKTATATQTMQEQTKAAAEARAVDKANLDGAIKLNEEKLKTAPEGPFKERLAREQRDMQARKRAIDLFEQADMTRRRQMEEEYNREGFKVRNLGGRPVVTPMTRAETLATPTTRPVQTVTPTEAAPAPAVRPQPVRTPLATRPADNAPEPEVKAYAVAENARREQIARGQGQRTGATPRFRSLPTDSAPAILAALREEDRLRAAAAAGARASRPPAPAPGVRPSRPPATAPPPAPPQQLAAETAALRPAAPAAPTVSAPAAPAPVVLPAAPPAAPAPVVLPAAPPADVTLPEPPAAPVGVAATGYGIAAGAVGAGVIAEQATSKAAGALASVAERSTAIAGRALATVAQQSTATAATALASVAEKATAAAALSLAKVAEQATATSSSALAAYDAASKTISKTEDVLLKVQRLAKAPGTAGEGAAAAGKAAELGAKIVEQTARGTEAANLANKAMKVAGLAGGAAADGGVLAGRMGGAASDGGVLAGKVADLAGRIGGEASLGAEAAGAASKALSVAGLAGEVAGMGAGGAGKAAALAAQIGADAALGAEAAGAAAKGLSVAGMAGEVAGLGAGGAGKAAELVAKVGGEASMGAGAAGTASRALGVAGMAGEVAGQGAGGAGKAAELVTKIGGQAALGAEAAGVASKALAVAGAASKVAGVLKPLAPIGAGIEAFKLAKDFSGETGRVEAAADKGLGPAMVEGLFAPLTTIAAAIKLAGEVISLNVENARAAGREDRGAGREDRGEKREDRGGGERGTAGETPALPAGETPAVRAGETPALLPPPQAAAPGVNLQPVVAGLDDSARAALAGGKAVAEAARRVNLAAQAGNEDMLNALEALAGRYETMSARMDDLQDRLKYGPS